MGIVLIRFLAANFFGFLLSSCSFEIPESSNMLVYFWVTHSDWLAANSTIFFLNPKKSVKDLTFFPTDLMAVCTPLLNVRACSEIVQTYRESESDCYTLI